MTRTYARCMVDVPSLRAVRAVEESIMRSPIVPIRGAEQRSRLGPRRLLEGVAALVREKAELVARRAAVAGREGKESLSIVIQGRWGFVYAEAVDLP